MEKKRSPRQPKQLTRKNGILLAGAGVLLIVLIALLVCVLFPWKEQVVKIGDNSVGADELRMYLNSNRADVIMRYTSGKGLEYNDRFWDTEVEGVTPMEEWLQLALDQCVYDNMIRILADEKGLSDSVSFDKLLDDLEKENRRRADAVSKGEVIYGPQQYTIDTYIQVTLANLYATMEKEYAAAYVPTDAELQAYYEANKESYVIYDIREIQQISIAYGDSTGLDQAGAEKIANEIREALTGGEKIEDVMLRYAQYAVLTDKEYDRGRNDQTDAMLIPQTYANAVALAEGACSPITDENSTFYISRCTALFPGGYETFDNMKESIAAKVSEKAFESYLQERIDSVRIEVDQEKLRDLALDIAG